MNLGFPPKISFLFLNCLGNVIFNGILKASKKNTVEMKDNTHILSLKDGLIIRKLKRYIII